MRGQDGWVSPLEHLSDPQTGEPSAGNAAFVAMQARLREFLLSFERELRTTRGVSDDRRPNDLVRYDNAARSTNDGRSYEVRLKTLLDRFTAPS